MKRIVCIIAAVAALVAFTACDKESTSKGDFVTEPLTKEALEGSWVLTEVEIFNKGERIAFLDEVDAITNLGGMKSFEIFENILAYNGKNEMRFENEKMITEIVIDMEVREITYVLRKDGRLEGTFAPATSRMYTKMNGDVCYYDKLIVRCTRAIEPENCVGDIYDLVEYEAYKFNPENNTNDRVDIPYQGVDWEAVFKSVTFNMEKFAFSNASVFNWSIYSWRIDSSGFIVDLFIQPSGEMTLYYYLRTNNNSGETNVFDFFRVQLKKHKEIPFKMEDVLGYWVPVKTAYYYQLKRGQEIALQDYYEVFKTLSYVSVAGDNIVMDGDDFPLTYKGDSFSVTGITNFKSHSYTVNAEGNLVERIERKSSVVIQIRVYYCQFDCVVTEFIKAKQLDYAIGGNYVLVNQDFYQGGTYKGSATDDYIRDSELKEFKLTAGQGLHGSSYSVVGPWMMIENILGRRYYGFIREEDDAFVFVSDGEASSVTVKNGSTINYNTTILTYKRTDK